MHTQEIQMAQVGRRRGRYSDEFKRQVIAACLEPGVSTAAIALANGLNANLARRWALRLHSATTPGYRRRQQRWHQFTPSLSSSPSNLNQCHQRPPSCNIPKTPNGAFNVGYRAGISRKSSSGMGTDLTDKLFRRVSGLCLDLSFNRIGAPFSKSKTGE